MKEKKFIPRLSLVIFAFLLLASSSLISSPAVLAKSYSIDQTQIDVFLESDGSAEVIERRSFNFQGDYRFVYQKINYQND